MSAADDARPVLEVEGLRKTYGRPGSGKEVEALRGVSFSVREGECVGLVGESGNGKSTIANLVMRLDEPTEGSIRLCGKDITHAKGKELREAYRHMQMVFQSPAESFDPRKTLGDGVTEGLRNAGVDKDEAKKRALSLFESCGLAPEMYDRRPREVSGGQCQRAAIARALALDPDLLICDEATSALDMTVQRQIVELLASLQEERGLSLLFICHDIALVGNFCDRVIVLKSGLIVEEGPTEKVLRHPAHPYTRELIAAQL